MTFKNYLTEEQVEETSFGVIKYRILKALKFMSENLESPEVMVVLSKLNCPNCEDGKNKKLIEGLKSLVENTTSMDFVIKQLYKNIKQFSF